jgi:hypothetical protein
MNTIRMCGGLGNQLFQYAFGQAQRNNGIEVVYDVGWYHKPTSPPRPFVLNKFRTNVEIEKKNLSKPYPRKRQEKAFNVNYLKQDGYYFRGYWQTPLYFESIRPQIEREIHVKEEFSTQEFEQLKEKILKENSVSVHIRRGDYLAGNDHIVLPLEYYDKALHIIETLKEDISIYVFSDDIEWCKKNFGNCMFVEMEDYLEFELMYSCKHHIIANSSFSGLAAHLGDSQTVISPKIWYKNAKGQVAVERNGLLLENWILI